MQEPFNTIFTPGPHPDVFLAFCPSSWSEQPNDGLSMFALADSVCRPSYVSNVQQKHYVRVFIPRLQDRSNELGLCCGRPPVNEPYFLSAEMNYLM